MSSSPDLDGLWLHDLTPDDPYTRRILVCPEREGHEDVFEDCSGEDPYNLWNEDDEGGIGGDGASPLDEYEGDEGDLEGEGASPFGEYKGDEGVLLVPSVFMSVLAASPDLPER